MRKAGYVLIGGGIAAITAAVFGVRKSMQTTTAIENAVQGKDSEGVPVIPGPVGYPKINVRLTGYWPFQSGLSATEKKMEGGLNDRKGKPLHTLEQHLADPIRHPYVSVAGDDSAWPYGQRVIISAWPKAIFRVVDTGGHFRGTGKLYRVFGNEPLDVCVASSKTVVPKKDVTAQIVPGDNFAKGMAVATNKFQGQTVLGHDGLGQMCSNLGVSYDTE